MQPDPTAPSAHRELPPPQYAYRAAQVRAFDRAAIDVHGIPGYELMCRAGQAALECLMRHWPAARRVLILCGAGNNAGDGYVLARLAMQRGLTVRVAAVAAPEQLTGEAARAWKDYRAAGGAAEGLARRIVHADADVAVDALLGLGLDRPLTGAYAEAVAQLNASGLPVLALDLPTGLDADSGAVLGSAVRARVTLSFVALKGGLFLGAAPDYCGLRECAELGVPRAVFELEPPILERLQPAQLAHWLPPRARTAHKGDAGRVLLIGGAPGMSGAIRLAAYAALRAGAGLVSIATHPESAAIVAAHRPELMCHAVDGRAALAPLLAAADVVVLGPGLGQSAWAASLWRAALRANRPLVADADALNLLAGQPARRDDWVLTPHPGEAARLLGCTTAVVQADRRSAGTVLAERFGAAVVLKGACTLVAPPGVGPDTAGTVAVCDRGNPGMASGGMGDVLAGLIGALVAQGLTPLDGARAGVLIHALAGDQAAQGGERGLLAMDLLEELRRWVNPASA